jgi:hypothetical protein
MPSCLRAILLTPPRAWLLLLLLLPLLSQLGKLFQALLRAAAMKVCVGFCALLHPTCS